MRKIYCIAFFSLALFAATHAQNSKDSLVLVYGKMLKAQDSTPMSGKIRYEKLPYYDDMGIASSKSDGSYKMQLVFGKQYNLYIKESGFKPYEQVLDVDASKSINLYVVEDIVELRKLENLNFGRNSDEITSSSFSELNELAIWMNDNPSIVIQLEGHTDFGGNAEASLRLSEARVEAVKEYLVDKKVSKNRIFTKAFGGTQPVTQERTPEARALNRRVEVRVIRR
ncbi:MAG: OmpA family protein [Ekhidna sp.]|nr:OmpA family protein [Ekhidna sp.]